MKPTWRLAIVLIGMLLLAGAASGGGAEEAYREAKQGYRTLVGDGARQLYRHNWERVIDRFLAVRKSYPRHPRAAAALYMAGKASRGLYEISRIGKDARQAVAYYDQLASEYPGDTLADDGLVLAGEILTGILGEPTEGYRRYRRALDLHPEGDMASTARRRLRDLARYAPAKAVAPRPDPASGGETQLTGVRHWSRPGYTRVVLELDARADFTANYLPGDPKGGASPRIYVDVLGARPAAELAEATTVDDGLLQTIRSGRPDGERVRVVLDLVSFEDYKVFPLNDPFRIVVDVFGNDAPQLTSGGPRMHAPAEDGVARLLDRVPAEQPLKVRIASVRAGGGLRRIVVDAGHGGKDPGAVGPSGVLEKDVTLSMAKALARRLEKDLGCEVILTRNGDVFLPLEERTALANKVGADLFISIHANAAENRSAYGVETYYLNFSKNDKAVAVAARENGTSLKEVGDLELILFDLMANSKINESSRLAAEIQKCLVDDLDRHYSKIRDLGVRQGPFYVLLGATMPSVLVETAFISNKLEESRLTDSRFQDRTVSAISRAVRNYAVDHKLIAER